MSCPLLTQNDWLENRSSSGSKIVYILIVVIGISLLSFQLFMEKSCKNIDNKSLKRMFRLLQISSIITIIVPLVLLLVGWNMPQENLSQIDWFSPNRQPPRFPIVFVSLVFLSLLSLLIAGLVTGIQIELSKSSCNSPYFKYVWIPVGILIILTIGIGIYRYKSNTRISIPKEQVDWTNVRSNINLLESIGRKQARECGASIPEGGSTVAFKNYLNNRDKEFRQNTNAFTRLFKKPQALPKDRIPNIYKMYHQLEQEINSINLVRGFNERAQQQETMRKRTKRGSEDVLESDDVFGELNDPDYNEQENDSEEGGYSLLGSVGTMAKKAVSAVGSGLSYSANLLGN